MHDANDDGDASLGVIDYHALRECTTLWAVSVPGESEWCTQVIDGSRDSKLCVIRDSQNVLNFL